MTSTLGRLADELLVGVTPDLPGKRAPALIDARNVLTDNLAIQPIPGQLPMFEKLDTKTILGLLSLIQGGTPTLYYGDRTAIYKYSADEPELVTNGFTGTDDDLWSLESWGNWAVATNGVDPVKVDKNDGAGFITLTGGWPTTVKHLLRYRAHLLGFNTSVDPRQIIWSHDDDIETIVPDETNTAGALIARELDSGIITALPLRDQIIFYSMNDAKLLSFVGGAFVFGQFPLLPDTGVVGKRAVASDGNFHYGFSKKGIWQTDGATVRYISQDTIWNYILRDINLEKLHLIQAWHLPQFQVIVFFYPQKSQVQNTAGIAYKYSNPGWWPIGYGRSAVLGDSVFQDPLTGTNKGDVFRSSITYEVPSTSGAAVAMKPRVSVGMGFGDHPFSDFFFGGEVKL